MCKRDFLFEQYLVLWLISSQEIPYKLKMYAQILLFQI